MRADALLLLVALQLLEMVKQLSPVIRADGYHILSDATGVPDLYAHIGPTLRRLLPWPPAGALGADRARARLLVTVWVLVVVPVLLSLALGAILLLPKLATTRVGQRPHASSPRSRTRRVTRRCSRARLAPAAVRAGPAGARQRADDPAARPHDRVARRAPGAAGRPAAAASSWSARPRRRRCWPGRGGPPASTSRCAPTDSGTLGALAQLVSSPRRRAARGRRRAPAAAPAHLAPGTHLAVAMIPVGGATKEHPALFVISGQQRRPAGRDPESRRPPDPSDTPTVGAPAGQPSAGQPAAPRRRRPRRRPRPAAGDRVPVQAAQPPGPGDTQALADDTTDGGVNYDVAYSLVTVTDGARSTNTNSAYALANCKACTTVAVSFQVVLIVGRATRSRRSTSPGR